MVPTDLNIGFKGLAFIQGQIDNPVKLPIPAFSLEVLDMVSQLHLNKTFQRPPNQGEEVLSYILYIYIFNGPPKPTFFNVFFLINNLVFRWPKPLFFMDWGLMVTTICSFRTLFFVSKLGL